MHFINLFIFIDVSMSSKLFVCSIDCVHSLFFLSSCWKQRNITIRVYLHVLSIKIVLKRMFKFNQSRLGTPNSRDGVRHDGVRHNGVNHDGDALHAQLVHILFRCNAPAYEYELVCGVRFQLDAGESPALSRGMGRAL